MSHIIIEHVDSVNIRVLCERSTAKELSDYFTFKVPNHKYHPAFRNRQWDGTIKLYNMFTHMIYAGLEKYILQFAGERDYTVEWSDKPKTSKSFTKDQVKQFIDSHLTPSIKGERIEAREHQIDAIHHAMNESRCLLLSPTGSGKSFIIYALMRYYLDILPKDKKVLIIVPTTGLVTQMYSDFAEYSGTDKKWQCDQHCHKVTAGEDKDDFKKRVIISTWQSIHRQPKKFFAKFGAAFGDECHMFKANCLKDIMTKMESCQYRIGTTGTLDDTLTHKLVIEGLFGPVFRVTKTKTLMEKNLLSELEIHGILLEHESDLRQKYKRASYQDEIDYLVSSDTRNQFISDLVGTLKGNTLVLFQYVEKHGKVLFEKIKKECPDHKVFFVHGGTDTEQREVVRQITEKTENSIIVASYGTFSTGISINRLHNIIFSSPSKSRIRVLQSIGRQLRKSKHKTMAKLFDIADDLSWKKRENYTLRHFAERLKIYKSEGFDHKIIRIPLKEKRNVS